MIKGLLIGAILVQIVVAIQTEGLTRSLAELSAFLLTVSLVFSHRRQKQVKEKIEPEEL